MKINKETLFSIILICFALVGKSMSHDKPSPTPSPSSSSSPTPIPTPIPSSSSPTSSPTPSASSPSPNEGRKTKTSSSDYTETNDQFSDTPYMDPPSDSPSPTTEGYTETNDQFSDTPYMDPPSDSPSPAADGDAEFGYSTSFSDSFSDYLKAKFGDQSKIKYNPSLQQICSHTHHVDVCLATISPLLKHKFDVFHALEASIIVCTENLKTIIARIEKHAAVSSEIAASLIDCKEHYSKALVNLHKALEAIHARKFGIVTIMLSGALADVSTAESKIVDLKLTTFKVEYFSFVSVTASNCLSIASLIPN